ncbi:hypothetical protein ABE527_10925 [Brucella sp. TWI432]
MIDPSSEAERSLLLNNLHCEVTFLRDLLEAIAENLLEVSPSHLPENAKDRVRLATTLAVVTRDRATETCLQMDKLFEVTA